MFVDTCKLAHLLRAGLGVQDIHVRTGWALADIRAVLAKWRREGRIYDRLGTDRQRNAEALRIMGIPVQSRKQLEAGRDDGQPF